MKGSKWLTAILWMAGIILIWPGFRTQAQERNFRPGVEISATESSSEDETTPTDESPEPEEETIAQPKLVRARAAVGRITVSWKKVKYATQFLVYRRAGTSKKYKKIATVKGASARSYVDVSVKPGISYTYTVRAVGRIQGKKQKSTVDLDGVSAVAKVPTVEMVTGLMSGKAAVVRWKRVADITGYRLYRKKDNGSFSLIAIIANPKTVRYRDKNVEVGHSYTYMARAYVMVGKRRFTSSAGRETVTVSYPVNAPQIETVSSGAGKVRIVWEMASDITGYVIYRRTGTSGKFKAIASTAKIRQNYFWDRTAVAGKEYTYAIASYLKVNGKRIYSDKSIQKDTVVCLPGTPFMSSVTREDAFDIVSWNSTPHIDGYIVYRKTQSSDNRWSEVARLDASTRKLQISRIEEGVTSYAVRAWVQAGDTVVRSPYLDTMSNEIHHYSNQKILFAGDSITYGYLEDKTRTPVPYPERVKRVTGIAGYQNASYTGCTIARRPDTSNSLAARVENGTISFEGYSVIWLAAGTNDYARNVEIGKVGDTSDTTIFGALNTIFAAIAEQNPTAKVVLMTPLYRGRLNNDWSKRGYYYLNSAGYSLEDYCIALKRAANKYGAYVFDSERQGIITEANYSAMLGEALHPTEETYVMLAKAISAYLVDKVMKPDPAS